MNNKGFTAVEVLLTVLIVSVLSFGGWYVWNERKEPESTTTAQETQQSQSDNQDEENKQATILNIKEIGLKIDLASTGYDDVSYQVESTDTSQGFYLSDIFEVYSRSLLNDLQANSNENFDCNHYVEVFVFNPEKNYEDLSTDIKYKEGALFVGTRGPCAPSSNQNVNQRLYDFRDTLAERAKETLQ